MQKNKAYQSLLKKMLIVELLGERLYNALAMKVKEKELKLAYQKLALNEYRAAKSIEKELSLLCKNNHLRYIEITISLAEFIFSLLPVQQLFLILKAILKKMMFNHWSNLHKDNNQEFWNFLLEHEQVQCEFMNKFSLAKNI